MLFNPHCPQLGVCKAKWVSYPGVGRRFKGGHDLGVRLESDPDWSGEARLMMAHSAHCSTVSRSACMARPAVLDRPADSLKEPAVGRFLTCRRWAAPSVRRNVSGP